MSAWPARLTAGGERLAFRTDPWLGVVLDLSNGVQLEARDQTYSVMLSASGEWCAFSGYIAKGPFELRRVGDVAHRYPAPVSRDAIALRVGDAREVVYCAFDHVARYDFVAAQSKTLAARRLGRGAGAWLMCPDGGTVAYVGQSKLFLYDTQCREIGCHRIPGTRQAFDAGPGGLVVISTWSRKLLAFRGDERRVLATDVHAEALAVSPDGTRVAWTPNLWKTDAKDHCRVGIAGIDDLGLRPPVPGGCGSR